MKKLFTITFLFVLAAGLTFAQTAEKKTDKNVKQGNVKINSTTATNAVTYDFTTGADKYYGTNGAVELEAGVWGMIAGDANGDGGVYGEDYTAYKNNQGNEGYEIADFNMDGGVYGEDYTIYKLNQGKETQVPQ